LPKTAGRSLGEELISRFDSGQMHERMYTPDKSAEVRQTILDDPSAVDNIRLVYGHQFWGIHQIWPSPVQYVTMLRDPIDRLISHYYYYNIRAEREAKDEGRDWKPYGLLRHARTKPFVCNAQTIMLAGNPAWGESSDSNCSCLPARPESIEQAKAHLRECVWFGLQDRYEESVLYLRKLMGWSHRPFDCINTNRHRPKTDEPAKVKLELEKHCWADIELYAYARDLWMERYGMAESVQPL